jgi:hypothetical protein
MLRPFSGDNHVNLVVLLRVIIWLLAIWIGGFFRGINIATPKGNNLLEYTLILLVRVACHRIYETIPDPRLSIDHWCPCRFTLRYNHNDGRRRRIPCSETGHRAKVNCHRESSGCRRSVHR